MWAMLDLLPVWVAVMLVATIGLAPLAPEPHVWEKLKMLAARLARRASKRA